MSFVDISVPEQFLDEVLTIIEATVNSHIVHILVQAIRGFRISISSSTYLRNHEVSSGSKNDLVPIICQKPYIFTANNGTLWEHLHRSHLRFLYRGDLSLGEHYHNIDLHVSKSA